MKHLVHAGLAIAGWVALSLPAMAQDQALHFAMNSKVLTPPPGMQTIGDSHGDIAVSPAGEIYVSVQGGDHPGIQVYSTAGRYLRNVPDAPPDLHGFIIARGPDRQPYIFGVSRLAQQIELRGAEALDFFRTNPPAQIHATAHHAGVGAGGVD